MPFTTVHNRHERTVFSRLSAASDRYPMLLANNGELLADAACVALNNLPSRYIRHNVDMSFYQSDAERAREEAEVEAAVEAALQYIQRRAADQPR